MEKQKLLKGGIINMKKILSMLLVSFMLLGMIAGVLAQESEGLSLPEAKEIGAWGSFSDSMRLAFTFNNEKRVNVSLEIAERRLAHIEALSETDPEAAAAAMENYEKYLAKAEEAAAKLEEARANSPNESLFGIEKMIRAQNRIEEHREKAEAIHLRAIERFEQNNVSDDKVAKFEELYAKGLGKLDDAEEKMMQKQANAEIKYKVLAGVNDSEVRARIRELEDEQGLLKLREERQARDEERTQRFSEIKERNIEKFKEMLQDDNLTDEHRARIEGNIEMTKQMLEDKEELDQKRRELEAEFSFRVEEHDEELDEQVRERIQGN